MAITASQLRQDVYNMLDKVIETGIPIEINRKDMKLKIVLAEPVNKLKNLKKRKIIIGKAEDLVNTNFAKEWDPFI